MAKRRSAEETGRAARAAGGRGQEGGGGGGSGTPAALTAFTWSSIIRISPLSSYSEKTVTVQSQKNAQESEEFSGRSVQQCLVTFSVKYLFLHRSTPGWCSPRLGEPCCAP